MATVQDLLDILDGKLHAYEVGALAKAGGTAAEARKIRAINAGKHKVWQLIVGSGRANRANWFAATDALTFGIGSNSQPLAADFHDLLWAESEAVLMKAAGQHRTAFQEDRAESGNADVSTLGALYYLVEGDANTKTLEISRKPDASLSVTAHYTATVAEWTASSDNIDVMPSPYWDAICNYACASLFGSLHDLQIREGFYQLWKDDIAMIQGATAHRNLGDVVSEEGFDTAG